MNWEQPRLGTRKSIDVVYKKLLNCETESSEQVVFGRFWQSTGRVRDRIFPSLSAKVTRFNHGKRREIKHQINFLYFIPNSIYLKMSSFVFFFDKSTMIPPHRQTKDNLFYVTQITFFTKMVKTFILNKHRRVGGKRRFSANYGS